MVRGFKRRSLHRVQQQIHDLWVSGERRRQVSAGWGCRQWEHRDGAKEMELSSSGMLRASDEAALRVLLQESNTEAKQPGLRGSSRM